MLLGFATTEVLRKVQWELERQLTPSVCITGLFLALLTCNDQQATGIKNTNVQRELGSVSQSSLI